MKLLSTAEAAAVLGVTRARVHQFARDGRLKPVTGRAAHYYRERDILRFRDLREAGLADGRKLPQRRPRPAAATAAGA